MPFVALNDDIDIPPDHLELSVERAPAIHRQKVHLLYHHAPLSLVITLATALLVVWAYWDSVPEYLLLGWISCIALALSARFFLLLQYNLSHKSEDDSSRWANRYVFGAFSTAVCWGLMSVIVFPYSTPAEKMFIAVVLGGMSAGSIPVLGVFRYAAILYIVPVVFPVAIQLLLSTDHMLQALGAMALCFIILMIGSANRTCKSIDSMLRLRLQKNELVKFLEKSNQEMRALNQELLLARDKAEESSRAKSQFLANMSHEFRTPLNGISAIAELLHHSPLNRTQRQDVNKLMSCVEMLRSHIDDVLDFSKISVGHVTISSEVVSLHELKDALIDLFETQAHKKNCSIQFDIKPNVSNTILSDQSCILHVVSNLLSNALKFSHGGGRITCSFSQEVDRSGHAKLRITVSDEGIGISKQDQKIVFDAFAQADSTLSKKSEGTGLGLAIAAHLVKLMEGKIWVESVVGQGSHFHVSIPIQLPDSNTEREPQRELTPQKHSKPIQSIHVLLAEDNALSREVVTRVLMQKGFTVTAVESGQKAIDALKRNPKETFDCVLMDLQMPEMDGITATKIIRKDPSPYSDIPIIALTGNAVEEVRAECLANGMNAFATKPIDFKELFKVIDSAIKGVHSSGVTLSA